MEAWLIPAWSFLAQYVRNFGHLWSTEDGKEPAKVRISNECLLLKSLPRSLEQELRNVFEMEKGDHVEDVNCIDVCPRLMALEAPEGYFPCDDDGIFRQGARAAI